MFQIVDREITAQEVIDAVADDSAGAIVTFLGVVRNQTRERKVVYLEYEAYQPMAERKLAEIASEIREKWDVAHIAVVHRTGQLEIGEASVAIAVSTPHRREGFAACQYMIDRLKEIVPIWKREVWEDGEEWVGPTS